MDLHEQRDEVLRLLANAKRKIYRLKTKGIVSQDNFGVIRDVKKIAKYNRIQLAKYADILRNFNSRSTGFVKLGSGYVTKEKWKQYKAAERRINRQRKRLTERMKKIPSPDGFITIYQERLIKDPDRPYMNKSNAIDDLHQVNRKSSSVRGPSQLDKLIKKLNEQATPEGNKKRIQAYRNQINSMLELFPDGKLKERVANLSDEEIEEVWAFSRSLPEAIVNQYLIYKRWLDDGEEAVERRYEKDVIANSENKIDKVFSWVEQRRVDKPKESKRHSSRTSKR